MGKSDRFEGLEGRSPKYVYNCSSLSYKGNFSSLRFLLPLYISDSMTHLLCKKVENIKFNQVLSQIIPLLFL